jgi:hypothetical protein
VQGKVSSCIYIHIKLFEGGVADMERVDLLVYIYNEIFGRDPNPFGYSGCDII